MPKRFDQFEQQVIDTHKYLDQYVIPREDNGGIFTIKHRIELLQKKYLENLSEIENYYLRKQPHVD